MDRHSKVAAIFVAGSLLFVLGHEPRVPRAIPLAQAPPHYAPYADGGEIIALHEIASPLDDDFRYCRVTIVGGDGITREVVLKAKKSLIADSIRCSVKDFFW